MDNNKSFILTQPNGSIYHLGLHPGEVAPNILLVGDQNRVKLISQHFDRLEITRSNREFVTHTGYIGNKRLSVVSTGIGTDNIDIVMHELDALFNIDLTTGISRHEPQQLTFIRIGTCGALQSHITPDTCVMSSFSCGFDGLIHYYEHTESIQEKAIKQHLLPKLKFNQDAFYVSEANADLLKLFSDIATAYINITAAGFYGPQQRPLRIPLKHPHWLTQLISTPLNGSEIGHIDMETSGIYALGRAFNHTCCSLAVVIDNLITEDISKNAAQRLQYLITHVLERFEKDIN